MGLELDGLVVAHPDAPTGAPPAVDGVSMSIRDGETWALLGPSGCGKSTLLRAVAGLVTPTAGHVRLAGRDLAGVPVHRRRIGMMFQDGALWPHKTVAANVAFGLKMAGADEATRRRRVGELLAMVGLDAAGERRPDQLSGGEAQRVALARTLAPDPPVVLLDEPLGSLDAALREALWPELARLLAGRMSLWVTHDRAEAFAVADRIAVMRAGRIVAAGTAAAVWQRPADAWVARFVGHRDVFDAVAVEGGVAASPFGPVRLADPVPDGTYALVCLPGALVPDPDGDVRATVRAGEFTGTAPAGVVQIGDVCVHVWLRPADVASVTIGATIACTLDPSALVAVAPAPDAA